MRKRMAIRSDAQDFACVIKAGRQLACVALALVATATTGSAQRPAGSDTLSSAAVAESLKVLAGIRASLDDRKNKNNGDLWYHRGMLSWALYLRDRTKGGLSQLDWTSLGREMDSSIRIASAIAPQNVRFQLTKGQYFASTGWSLLTLQSLHVFDVALERARESRDPQLIAEAAIEKGRVHWRRYGLYGFATAPANAIAGGRSWGDRSAGDRSAGDRSWDDRSLSDAEIMNRDLINYDPRNARAMKSLRSSRDFYGGIIQQANGDFSGEVDYHKAEEFFREAYGAKPTFPRAFTSLAMVLEERQRWRELTGLARSRIAEEPHNALAWMALGLAMHRSGNSIGALAAFDRGLTELTPNERARVDNIERVMRPSDLAKARAWTPKERTAFEDWYWVWSAPLWSLEETKPRAEFLARVTAAELRWTTDDFAPRGADTDRGNIFVRYGPSTGGHGGYGEEAWRYDYSGLAFYFQGVPGFGTAYFTSADDALTAMDSVPARWDNLVRVRVDSIPVRTARFRTTRATPDSLDVVFTLAPLVTEIRQSADLDVPVHLNFWLFNEEFSQPWHDTSGIRAAGPLTITRRLTGGDYMYRFEATHEAATIGGRASSSVSTMPDSATEYFATGFGISDLLIGSRAVPRGAPRRWSDFDVEPHPGEFAQGADLALVWENYDLGERNGAAEYSVRVIIERKWQMFLNRVRARVIAAFAAMMGSEQTSDRVIFRYERNTSYAATIPDYITIALADTPPGFYEVTLEITDKVTGRVTSRMTKIRISD